MRTIHFTQRQARVLRENLTQNNKGYDFLDLRRLDHLANKLTELQGEYGETMAALTREDKQIRRQLARKIDVDANTERLMEMAYEVEDLHEAADRVEVCFAVEDGDYNLIKTKLDAETNWIASDDIRSVVLGLVQAVEEAEKGEVDAAEKPAGVKQFRRK